MTPPPGRRAPRSASGVTLVELMVAMAIFLVLGLMLASVLSGALSLWREGESGGVVYERAEEVFRSLHEDLDAAFAHAPAGTGDVRAQFLCDPDPDAGAPPGAQRLAFVRTFGGGPERAYLADAGDTVDATGWPPSGGLPAGPDDMDLDLTSGRVDEEYYDGADDDNDGFVDEDLRAVGGLAAVAYARRGRDLVRGLRAPVDAAPETALASAQRLCGDVLYLGFQFWTQETCTWADVPPVPARRSAPRGPERLWDSTRGRTGALEAFLFNEGPASLADPSDDVFPELVRVVLILEPSAERARRTVLRTDFLAEDEFLRVGSTRGFPEPPRARDTGGRTEGVYALVGDEWVEYSVRGDRTLRIAPGRRGCRGTRKRDHLKGTEVRVGRTFVAVFRVPAYREDWGRLGLGGGAP